jgi:hypothetical protein
VNKQVVVKKEKIVGGLVVHEDANKKGKKRV